MDSAQPQKTANIWHLVCAEPGLFGPGDDYELLVRRCSAFVGVSATASVIENGSERLGFGHPPFTRDQLSQINARNCQRALDRAGLRRQWQDALNTGTVKQMTDGLKAPEESLPHGFVLANTITALLIQAGYAFIAVLEYFGRALGRVRRPDFWSFIELALGVAAVVSLPWSVLALWRFIRHGFAEVFAQRWKSLVGPVQLVYTRTPEGRKMLLRARNHSLSGSFQDRAERVSCWK